MGNRSPERLGDLSEVAQQPDGKAGLEKVPNTPPMAGPRRRNRRVLPRPVPGPRSHSHVRSEGLHGAGKRGSRSSCHTNSQSRDETMDLLFRQQQIGRWSRPPTSQRGPAALSWNRREGRQGSPASVLQEPGVPPANVSCGGF